MTAVLLAVSLAAVIALGTNAGVHICGVVALNPALRALDAPTYVTVKQSADLYFPALMKPLTLTGLGALLAQTAIGGLDGNAGAAIPAALGLVAAVAALVVVFRGDQPINDRMAAWAVGDPPTDWSTWRSRWEQYFRVRTLATMVAFLAALTGLVLR